MSYKDFITEVPHFPSVGVNFKDISPLLADQETFRSALVDMGGYFDDNLPDYWVGVDSRGFLFAGGLASYFGGGVVMCRKKGKLPPPTLTKEYELEYGNSILEMQYGSGSVVIVDDVLATGGTLGAVNSLCENVGYNILGNVVLIDLKFIPKIEGIPKVKSVIRYD